ncbi:MAG: EAL domain-containing protein [Myxococcales bacterium]
MRKILLVDDDQLLLRALQSKLASKGFDVQVASDRPSAVSAAEHVDVVVSDICMPDFSGIQLLQELRSRSCQTPVILMTGSPALDTAMKAVEFGAVHYLPKPFTIDTLKGLVEHAMAYHGTTPINLKLVGDVDTLSQRFESALAKMFMVFQPIVSVSQRRVIGYEALLRTDEPSFKNPLAFVSAAETLRRLPDLGAAVRNSVAGQLHLAPVDVDVFVNLHPLDLADPNLYEPLAPLSQVAPRIVLELTERAGLESVDDVLGRLAKLRALGFRLAVDDLGAGYAGLSTVADLAPEVIKLDVTLVRGIHADARRQRMVAMLSGLFRELKTPTVVEGVETESERDAIRSLGGDIMQGYLFARPKRGFEPIPDSAYG